MAQFLLCLGEKLEEEVGLARARGWGVEVQAFYHPDVLDHPEQALARHAALLQGFVGLRSLHGPFGDLCPGSFDPLVREVAARRIRQGLEVAQQLGIPNIVLHHGFVPNTSTPANWVKRSVTFWRELLASWPAEVRIHLENLLDHAPDQLCQIVAQVADPRLGICLDIGHAHALSRRSVVEWVRACAPHLTYVHLHDNEGQTDQHLPLGKGNLPVAEVLAALQELAPRALWAIECDPRPTLVWLQDHGFAPSGGTL